MRYWTPTLTGDRVFYPSTFLVGQPSSSQLILIMVAPAEILLPEGLQGSTAWAEDLPATNRDFTIRVNNDEVGYIRFTTASHQAVFNFTQAVTLAQGDVLRIIAPVEVDATLAHLAITLKGTRL